MKLMTILLSAVMTEQIFTSLRPYQRHVKWHQIRASQNSKGLSCEEKICTSTAITSSYVQSSDMEHVHMTMERDDSPSPQSPLERASALTDIGMVFNWHGVFGGVESCLIQFGCVERYRVF